MEEKYRSDIDRGLEQDVIHELDVGPLPRVHVRVRPPQLEGLAHQEPAEDLSKELFRVCTDGRISFARLNFKTGLTLLKLNKAKFKWIFLF